ncbi:MAG TPA: methyltransferase [Bacteroidia bacterium]|nr:methyltransferase [Bacteroidia bacterium]
MEVIDKNYWEKRWENKETGWDTGAVTTPLKTYFDQLIQKEIKILIPGCGNAYEAEYLFLEGFKNTYIIDIAAQALESFSKRVPNFPKTNLICDDFFNHQNQYDLIIEQTFFCALDPKQRDAYIKKMHELLKPNGKLVGLLFNIPLNTEHPPFGGNKIEYEKQFSPYFNFKHFDVCYNSIKPRENNELFIVLEKA